MEPTLLIAAGLVGLGFLRGDRGSTEGWWTKKTDALAKKRGLKDNWLTVGGETHYDLRRLPNYRPAAWHQYPDHEEYFHEVYRALRRQLPPAASHVVFAHMVKAQGWGKEGTKSRIPDHNNLGAWASSPQCLDGEVKFMVAKDPAIGGQAFRWFASWDEMIDYYLSRFNARSYLNRNFSGDPRNITKVKVQAYMRSIKRWLSAKTDPDRFGAAMYTFIQRTRKWV
jgi:hypothetical protein